MELLGRTAVPEPFDGPARFAPLRVGTDVRSARSARWTGLPVFSMVIPSRVALPPEKYEVFAWHIGAS
jgi:hypothetical protein